MKKLLHTLYTISLRDLFRSVNKKNRSFRYSSADTDILIEELRRRFSVYTTTNLKHVSAEEFERYIKSQLGVTDAELEGYQTDEISHQRDMSVRFQWGHNHDFGTFSLTGPTGEGYIHKLVNFIECFDISLDDFRDKYVFDVGCWTGGTTLLLATISGKVYAVEEVKKYAQMVSYLASAFGVDDRVQAEARSIYACNSKEFYDRFDIVYFPGVIYHLSDPLLSLRILFNSLKIGGKILVESAGIDTDESLCQFEGSLVYHEGKSAGPNRKGWNWFLPSPCALYRMMREVGFDDICTHWHKKTGRVYGYGCKTASTGICRAGLSMPDIP